jgi:hypothetical protein
MPLEADFCLGNFSRRCLYEILDWDIRVSVCRVEGKLLPGRFARCKNVAVLRGTPFDYRNQLHVPSDSRAEDDR